MDNGGHVFPVLFCFLNAEMVGSALLNTDVEAGLGCVRNLLVEKVGCCRLVLLVPECDIDQILNGADCYVDVSVSENKEVKLPLMTLFQRLGIVY